MSVANIAFLLEAGGSLIEAWNENNVNRVISFYSEDAILFDEDAGEIVSGKNEIKDYLSITFEFAQTRDVAPMKLQSEQRLEDGEFILEFGTYHWPKMHCGRYFYKWQYQNNGWQVVAHYFTIKKSFAVMQIAIQNKQENDADQIVSLLSNVFLAP